MNDAHPETDWSDTDCPHECEVGCCCGEGHRLSPAAIVIVCIVGASMIVGGAAFWRVLSS